jgi:peroxiredoxin
MKAALILLLLASPALAGAEKASPIGKKLDAFQLRDYRGAERSLKDFADRKLIVLAFMGSECPVAKVYGPRLAQLSKEFEAKGVAFLGINANQQDSISSIAEYAKLNGITFPILKDVGNHLADQLGAVRTPEVFVLDGERAVRYWGRIDDQYGVGYTRPKIGRRDLALALEELLAGKPVSQPTTTAPGCFIGRVQPEAGKGSVTYCKHIAPILLNRCVECHHPGEIGPFSLTNYEEVIGWTETIREVIEQQRMPPWHADPKYGQFANDSRLPEAERRLILEWIENGTPQGDLKDLPKPVVYTHGWRIPKPDVVVTIPRPVKVPAEGTVRYQYLAVDPGFEEDRWVKAAEVRPGCRPVVHHVLVFVQPPGARGSDRRGGFASNWLAASVPGAKPMILADGQAKRIPAGSRLLFQIHYTPNGSPQTDQTCLGLVFADPKTVRQEVSTEMVANPRLRIPANAEDYPVEATETLREDALVLTLMPHTHLRGKTFQFEAIYPDGKHEILLDLPHYDFNWQNTYVLAKPKLLPRGTKLHVTAHYNNSRSNLSNPDPNQEVRWGEQTWQEMLIGYYDMIVPGQDLVKNPTKATPKKRPESVPLDPALEKAAQHALDSQQAFGSFAAELRKALPKIDRVCVTTYTDDQLQVERSAYPGDVKTRFAETGFKAPGRASMLAVYALMNQFAVNGDLAKTRAADLKGMSASLASGVHVPAALEGRPATVNFWSKEKDAFPAETYDLLRTIAAAVTHRK